MKVKTSKQLIDEAIELIREVGHRTPGNTKAHRHIEFALGMLREAWIDLDGQKARTAEEIFDAIARWYEMSDALFARADTDDRIIDVLVEGKAPAVQP